MIELLLPVVPLLFVVGSLFCGRYPGLETAMRLAERVAARRAGKPADEAPPRPSRPAPRIARGGLLIAFRLAQRPPPLAP